MVPPPHEQLGFIQNVHLEFGHFRVKHIYSLLTPHYYWRGMLKSETSLLGVNNVI
jgi:hypothetical protein